MDGDSWPFACDFCLFCKRAKISENSYLVKCLRCGIIASMKNEKKNPSVNPDIGEGGDLFELLKGVDKCKLRQFLDGLDFLDSTDRFMIYGRLGLFDGYSDLVRTCGDSPDLDLSIGGIPAGEIAARLS